MSRHLDPGTRSDRQRGNAAILRARTIQREVWLRRVNANLAVLCLDRASAEFEAHAIAEDSRARQRMGRNIRGHS